MSSATRSAAVFGSGSCATTTSGAYVCVRISETAANVKPSCSSRCSAARSVWPSDRRDGRALADPRSATPGRCAGSAASRRRPDPGPRPGRLRSWDRRAACRPACRLRPATAIVSLASVAVRLTTSGHLNLARSERQPHRRRREQNVGREQGDAEQDKLARAPHARSEGHEREDRTTSPSLKVGRHAELRGRPTTRAM